jgi:hypothetical protein
MAATQATRRTNRTASTRRRLDRRGRHTAAHQADSAARTPPAMHVTPNVAIAARGDVRGRRERSFRRLRSSALDLRRFRA